MIGKLSLGINSTIYSLPDRQQQYFFRVPIRISDAVRLPFWPNSGYAFAVGDDTYHSVDTVGPEVRTRDSIILTYFVDRTLVQVAHNRWKRFGNYLLAEARAVARLATRK